MIEVITNAEHINLQAWNSLSQQSSTATWFQTHDAYCFFNSLPSIFTTFTYGIKRDNELKAICTGYITKDKNHIKNFFTRRAIITGGPMLADDITEEELSVLLKTLQNELNHKVIYIETRNFNDYSKWKKLFELNGFNYIKYLNFHLDCSDEKTMMKRMSESKVRQIKKSLKNGVQIIEAENEKQVESFYNILKDLYNTKVKKPLFPKEFFYEFYRQKIGKFLLIKYETDVIGGIMCPILNNKTIYELFVTGLDKEYKSFYPSIVATFAAMNYATNHNISRFDFMGAGKPDEDYGVRDFKSKFGGDIVEHGRFLCISNHILFQIGTCGIKLLKHCVK